MLCVAWADAPVERRSGAPPKNVDSARSSPYADGRLLADQQLRTRTGDSNHHDEISLRAACALLLHDAAASQSAAIVLKVGRLIDVAAGTVVSISRS